ncbi:FAD binding domain-containing protein [Bradyrhizobium sp. NP1]|uniref:FAD binding domain-containing protein n=1 Tax=Bradyrhizobium sp. NP1 TaxID=3049772 RepID=UPI0025A65D19|nr:FAD binding domain-containing protein [Bradyrhizobium sp. NP1]WJR77888.1 FAD binding domain-containing protein [Bradyrhizobium sp. NP1]
MKPVNFEYMRPSDVVGALKLIASEAASAKIMAGNQSLGPMLNLRLVQPDLVVDITAIEEVRRFEDRSDEILIGACVTHADIEDGRVPDVTRGALPAVARGIAYRAVRNRGTIGGSLTHADPSADWHSLLAALGAKVVLRGPAGERTIAVEDYMLGALEADIRSGEMLVGVKVPKLGRNARWGYYKSCRKTGEFAHAIGAFLADPDRGVSRAVIGATESRPIVVANAANILGDGRARRLADNFDGQAVAKIVEAAGIADPLSRQTYVVALRRAIEQAQPQ